MRNSIALFAAVVFWPSLALIIAVTVRATYEHFVLRPRVEARLKEDRDVARLEEWFDYPDDPLKQLYRLPSREGRVS